jgi:hypothetical protein
MKKLLPSAVGAVTGALVLLMLLGPLPVQTQKEGDLSVRIEREIRQDTLRLLATAVNLSETTVSGLTYEWVSSRTDARGNRSQNKQGGHFKLAPNEHKVLSDISLNLGRHPQVSSHLMVRNLAGERIAEDRITINPEAKAPATQPSAEGGHQRASFHAEDVELNGIFVLDNTRTRAGHDFYDLLYQTIGQLEVPGSFQIVLEEIPGLGTSSTIQIFLNGQLIFYNNLNPKYDFLVELADYCSQLLINRMSNYQQFQDNLEGEGSGIY